MVQVMKAYTGRINADLTRKTVVKTIYLAPHDGNDADAGLSVVNVYRQRYFASISGAMSL